MGAAKTVKTWQEVHHYLLALPPRARIVVPRDVGFPHPRDAGARPTTAWPECQRSDYRLEITRSEPALIIQEFEAVWKTALETGHQLMQGMSITGTSSRSSLYVGAAMLGGAVGGSASPRREGALVGAGIGLLLAALLDRRAPRRR